MNNSTREKLLKMALVAFGAIFFSSISGQIRQSPGHGLLSGTQARSRSGCDARFRALKVFASPRRRGVLKWLMQILVFLVCVIDSELHHPIEIFIR
jgi:hypothetical protein